MKNLKHNLASQLGTDKFDEFLEEMEQEFIINKKKGDKAVKELAEDESWNEEQKKEIQKYLKTR